MSSRTSCLPSGEHRRTAPEIRTVLAAQTPAAEYVKSAASAADRFPARSIAVTSTRFVRSIRQRSSIARATDEPNVLLSVKPELVRRTS